MNQLTGVPWLMVNLPYGAGLRQIECLRLRVQDVDFSYNQITVRSGKGDKDRIIMLPHIVKEPLKRHLEKVKYLHEMGVAQSFGQVYLPAAIERKFPNAAKEWAWQYVFAAKELSIDPRTGAKRRLHQGEWLLQREIKQARIKAGLIKRISCHSFRHSFVTHLLQNGYDIRTVQELLGHNDVRTTMIYTQVIQHGGQGVRSPADMIRALPIGNKPVIHIVNIQRIQCKECHTIRQIRLGFAERTCDSFGNRQVKSMPKDF